MFILTPLAASSIASAFVIDVIAPYNNNDLMYNLILILTHLFGLNRLRLNRFQQASMEGLHMDKRSFVFCVACFVVSVSVLSSMCLDDIYLGF